MAIEDVRKRNDVARLQDKIMTARSNLSLLFMVYNASKGGRVDDQITNDTHRVLAQIRAELKKSDQLAHSTDVLSSKMTTLQCGDMREDEEIKRILARHTEVLTTISGKLEQNWSTEPTELTRSAKDMSEGLSNIKDRLHHDLRTQHAILDSLHDPQLNKRRDNIKRAHRETYR